jgi:hypothetical protein
VTSGLDAFSRELEIAFDEMVGLEGRKTIFISTANDQFTAFRAAWRREMGDVTFERFVDGVEGKPLSSVQIPGGMALDRVISKGKVVARAIDLVDRFTKVLTGDFKSYHRVYINNTPGAFRDPGLAGSDIVQIVNVSDFARRAEVRGYSDQPTERFPNGLLAGVAAVLINEFRTSPVDIRFDWEEFAGERLPNIRIE